MNCSDILGKESLNYLFLYDKLPFTHQIQTKQIRPDIYYPYKMSFKEKFLAFLWKSRK